MKMEETECSETSAYKFKTRGNHPKESIQHVAHYCEKREREKILYQRGGVYRVRNLSWFGNLNVVKWWWLCFLWGEGKMFQEVEIPGIYRQSAPEGGKVVSRKHRPPLTLRK